ncbi:uncharacterized protein Aud_006897 [Aspergillus udagawae]|uniref:Uncharacterized protein n=1 Tax=Aspergillus udagawae TaxID=91492 RepID=A0A8E0V0G0_9EURO|nr:uncharacterized protein Aud_006897 [Aspergillus udagawae]GIC90463.1 hypothetical protein Aud_006897 [Aspergillus udagawae]
MARTPYQRNERYNSQGNSDAYTNGERFRVTTSLIGYVCIGVAGTVCWTAGRRSGRSASAGSGGAGSGHYARRHSGFSRGGSIRQDSFVGDYTAKGNLNRCLAVRAAYAVG